ncbi:MAG: hypothetical protein F9K40_21205, partial [Kofleriaceae bacterium]
RLEGYEQDWQDAGTRRVAYYTNPGPGDYVFRVLATNNDGVWNEVGARIAFSIAPRYYQTPWFAAACVTVAAALLWVAYLLRLRRVSRQIHDRLQERHQERERIARELHDTLLQSVQGLILRFHAVARSLGPGAPGPPSSISPPRAPGAPRMTSVPPQSKRGARSTSPDSSGRATTRALTRMTASSHASGSCESRSTAASSTSPCVVTHLNSAVRSRSRWLSPGICDCACLPSSYVTTARSGTGAYAQKRRSPSSIATATLWILSTSSFWYPGPHAASTAPAAATIPPMVRLMPPF